MARAADLDPQHHDLRCAPRLVVEVLSPSTQVVDRNLKLYRYEAAGVPSYWLLDPDGPTLTAYELGPEGRYRRVAEVTAQEGWTASAPFDVTITPGRLET